MTIKLYFCSTCTCFLGDDPKDSVNVEEGHCLNCNADGPHAVGDFENDAATNLLNRARYGE